MSAANETRVCIIMPPKVQSRGLGLQIFPYKSDYTTSDYDWYGYSLPRLELQVALIYAITQCFNILVKRLGVPLFTSQLVAGLILSHAMLQEKSEKLWTQESIQVIGSVSTLGYSLFVFLTGVKTDPSLITRGNITTFSIGVLSVITPLLVAVPIVLSGFDPETQKDARLDVFFLLPFFAMTSFPVITVLLSEMKILNSELGRMTLSSGTVADLLSVSILFFGEVVRIWVLNDGATAFDNLKYQVIFLVIVFIVIRPGMLMVVRYTPEGKPINDACIYVIMLLLLFCIGINKWINLTLFAPYILGLAVPHGPPLGSALVEKFESMVHNLFLPLFVASCGLRLKSLAIAFDGPFMKVTAAIAILCPVVKLIVSFLPSLFFNKMPTKDALALAFLLSSKGIVDIGLFSFLYDAGAIDYKLFGLMFCIILYMGSIVPVMVKHLYDPERKYAGYHKRSLMHWKPLSELPIVAVIHVPDNVTSVISLLEASNPTKENPMSINVLHLIKLSGQVTPIFISHQGKRRSTGCTDSYSENLIMSFKKFQNKKLGAVTVNAFTAVSPPNLMHDDICMLALDKFASFIILPYHRRWYTDGSMESDNDYIRTLNSRVLEKAPCSVGIFIDRGNIGRAMPAVEAQSPDLPLFKIAVIFLGGSDDREALTLAKRMSQDSRVALTVLNLRSANGGYGSQWEALLDGDVLRGVQSNGYVDYMEKEVADGPETAIIVHSMLNEFNLIIVGRRHNVESPQTTGLGEWSEYPELGILGDLLASVDHSDHSGTCSVLVVQQQETVLNNRDRYMFH